MTVLLRSELGGVSWCQEVASPIATGKAEPDPRTWSDPARLREAARDPSDSGPGGRRARSRTGPAPAPCAWPGAGGGAGACVGRRHACGVEVAAGVVLRVPHRLIRRTVVLDGVLSSIEIDGVEHVERRPARNCTDRLPPAPMLRDERQVQRTARSSRSSRFVPDSLPMLSYVGPANPDGSNMLVLVARAPGTRVPDDAHARPVVRRARQVHVRAVGRVGVGGVVRWQLASREDARQLPAVDDAPPGTCWFRSSPPPPRAPPTRRWS